MKFRSILLGIVAVLATFQVQGQILDAGNVPKTGTFSGQGGSYYNFSSGTGCDFKVSVWGFVNNPGRYNIPCETNLMEMISFCGGVRRGSFLNKVKVIRKGGVEKQSQIDRVYQINLEKYLELSEDTISTAELALMPGDLVIVDGEDPVYVDPWLRVSQAVVAIASLVSATIAILNYSK
jgi:hypothetical protein